MTTAGKNGGPGGEVYVVSAARTPIGRFLGSLADVPATVLGSVAMRAALERAQVSPEEVDEAYVGQVLQAGAGQAPARLAALGAGLPASVPATTVNRVCGSGLKAVMLAAASIRAGDADVLVAGGMESMSGAPYLLPRGRRGYRLGHGEVLDSAVLDGLWCATDACHMGTHAERVAAHAGVSREDQDAYALESHRRAVAAMDAGRFDDELVPVPVHDERGRRAGEVTADEAPRRDTSPEALARLRPAFALPDAEVPEGTEAAPAGGAAPAAGRSPTTGTVTAGNAPGLADGAAAAVVASERAVERLGLRPLARIVGYAQADREPRWLFLAPVAGVRRLLERTGLELEAFDLVEINEAFAAQALADGRELGLDWTRANVNGGAIALGHPIGASGARIVATLLHELRRREGRYALATLCLGGGGSVAMAFERVA
jgi:acetyl-CoA C-acetyltransferase